MTLATRNEIEYLNALDRDRRLDRDLFEALGDRLEALRRFDQWVSESDWHPRHVAWGVDIDRPLKDL
ncbi:MAG: hypothetical protein U0805_02325 [Pirellulales bacterium]